MFDDAADPFAASQTEAHRILIIKEDVVALFILKRAVGVHAAAVNSSDGFRHKGGQIAMFTGDEFHDLFEGLDVIASLNDVRETEVDFFLARGDFVMGGLNDETQFFEFERNFAADVFGAVDRGQIEIGTMVALGQAKDPDEAKAKQLEKAKAKQDAKKAKKAAKK